MQMLIVDDRMENRCGIFGFIDETGKRVCPSLTREIWENCRVPEKQIAFPHDTWTGILMLSSRLLILSRFRHLETEHVAQGWLHAGCSLSGLKPNNILHPMTRSLP